MRPNSHNETEGDETTPPLVPNLRFPKFREIGGWTESPLGTFLTESRLPGSKGNLAKKITVKLWGNGVFEKNEAIQGSINTQYFRRMAGQFIYSKLDFLNQAFGIIPQHLNNFESTADLPCFDFTEGVNPVFLLAYVKRKDFYERLGETADGSRKARRIQAETFLAFPIACPSLSEQQRIADCLGSLDELLAVQARKVEALKAHKKGLMQQLFPQEGETQPRRRFPEFQDAGEWEAVMIGDLFRVTRGEVLSMTLVSETASEEAPFPVYSSQTTNNGLAGFYSEHLYEDSITWTTDGANAGDVNFRRGQFFCTNVCGVLINTDGYSNSCVAALLNGVTRSHVSYVGNPKLMNGVMAKIEISLPSVAEQHRIADCLTSLDDLITAESTKLSALKTHKKGLMQQLFPSPAED
jgi:type I restriction enzyme S subunit